jgi:hypothetical protein
LNLRRSLITDELIEIPLMVWALGEVRANVLDHDVGNIRDIWQLLIHVANQEVRRRGQIKKKNALRVQCGVFFLLARATGFARSVKIFD